MTGTGDRAGVRVGERPGTNVVRFAVFGHAPALSDADRAWLDAVLPGTPAPSRPLVHTPARTRDPDLDDGRPPALVLQPYFADLAGLDAAPRHPQILATPDALASLCGAATTQRPRLARAFPVPEPCRPPVMGSDLVANEGEADYPDAWLAHHTSHHTAIMARFPGIREIEVGTRLDWPGALPGPHVNHILRNEVVFDDPPALTAALNSPVRHAMGADYATSRKFAGPVAHVPMRTAIVDPCRVAGAVAPRRRGG